MKSNTKRKIIPTYIKDITIYEQYRKIRNKVYWYYSFDQGLTWDRKLTPFDEVPYGYWKLC